MNVSSVYIETSVPSAHATTRRILAAYTAGPSRASGGATNCASTMFGPRTRC